MMVNVVCRATSFDRALGQGTHRDDFPARPCALPATTSTTTTSVAVAAKHHCTTSLLLASSVGFSAAFQRAACTKRLGNQAGEMACTACAGMHACRPRAHAHVCPTIAQQAAFVASSTALSQLPPVVRVCRRLSRELRTPASLARRTALTLAQSFDPCFAHGTTPLRRSPSLP
jgi:hypothetical protein